MSAMQATAYVRRMIHLEAAEAGDYENAMRRIERQYKIGFWTLDHFRKRKAKTCEVSLFRRIEDAFVDFCERHAFRVMREARAARKATAQAIRTAEAEELRHDSEEIRAEIERLTARLALVGEEKARGAFSARSGAEEQMGRQAHG